MLPDSQVRSKKAMNRLPGSCVSFTCQLRSPIPPRRVESSLHSPHVKHAGVLNPRSHHWVSENNNEWLHFMLHKARRKSQSNLIHISTLPNESQQKWQLFKPLNFAVGFPCSYQLHEDPWETIWNQGQAPPTKWSQSGCVEMLSCLWKCLFECQVIITAGWGTCSHIMNHLIGVVREQSILKEFLISYNREIRNENETFLQLSHRLSKPILGHMKLPKYSD